MKKVLVIAAHPDDEVLGCGGTMARLAREGDEVYTLILGEGITARDEKRSRGKREREILRLKQDIRSATKILGGKRVLSLDFPDNRFDTVALLDIVKAVEKVIDKIRPEIVFTHHRGDLNIDHQITFRAVMTACRPLAGATVKEIYAFEVLSSSEWSASSTAERFAPNCYIDISGTLDFKTAALREYRTEIRRFPHPRSPESVEIAAQHRGVESGFEAAEAFETIRIIR